MCFCMPTSLNCVNTTISTGITKLFKVLGEKMSALEQMIWNILGYSSMPVIFLTGFACTALVAVALLKLLGAKAIKPE